MSDVTYRILTDRTAYPDDTEIQLSDGSKVTVKEFREAVLPKGDFTREADRWAEKERQYQQAVQGLQGQIQQVLAERAAAPQPAARPPAGGYTEEELLADPVLGPLVKRQQEALQRLESHEARLKQHEETWIRNQYMGQLTSLKGRYNARYNPDGKGKAFDEQSFLDYAVKNQIPNLEAAYSAYTLGDEVARATAEAEQRGIEKGKAAARVPAIPLGRRSTPPKPAGMPSSLQEVTDEMLMQDPDIIAAMRGEEA